MKIENIVIDANKTYGELRFFGLEKENFEYNTALKQRTNIIESRVYKALSMQQGDMIELTIPTYVKKDRIQLDNNTLIELLNPKLSVTASAVSRGTHNSAELKPLLQVDDIIPIN